MKLFLIVTITLIFFSSCTDYKEKIIGEWIEKDNFTAPRILKFSEDYFTKPHNDNEFYRFPYEPSKYLYKIREDTLIYYENFNIKKQKLTITNNELTIHSDLSDTLVDFYSKNNYENYISYVNANLNLSIQLPKGKFGLLNWEYKDNTIYIDLDENNNPIFLLNGKPINIDTDFHNRLRKFYNYNGEIICFADSNLLVKYLIPLKIELSKANYRRAYFGLIDDKNNLGLIPLVMPIYKYNPPDSLLELPPPPKYELSLFENRPFILCEIYPEYLKINKIEKTYVSFIQVLTERIIEEKRTHLLLYYSENLGIQDYINFAIEISHSIESIKKTYFEKKYDGRTYWQLNEEERKEFNDNFIVVFNEILKDDLNILYEYL